MNFAIEVYDTLGVYLGNDSVFGIKNDRYLFNPVDEPWYTNKVGDNGIASIFWRSFDVEKKGKGSISDPTTNEKTLKEINLLIFQRRKKCSCFLQKENWWE